MCLYNQPICVLRLCCSRIVYEHKTKDVQSRGPCNINLSLFVCSLMLIGLIKLEYRYDERLKFKFTRSRRKSYSMSESD